MKRNINWITKGITSLALTSSYVLLISCAATSTIIEHRNLETTTQLNPTVFLDPAPQSQKTMYIKVKNTSQESLAIDKSLQHDLEEQGYKVVKDSSNAHYLLQVNIRKVGKMSVTASQSALGGGYGSVLAGAVAGAAAGSLTHSSTGLITGGLAGGVIGLAADSLVKDVNYTMITDVQISEKVGKGVRVKEEFQSHLAQGSSTIISQTASQDSQYKRYRTRIVSNADKVNLKFADARFALEQGLVKTLSGIF